MPVESMHIHWRPQFAFLRPDILMTPRAGELIRSIYAADFEAFGY
jgi:hypothetical protein